MTKTLMPMPEDKDLNQKELGATDIGAYIYNGKTLCSRCVRDIVVPLYRIADSHLSTERILNEAAARVGIDRFKQDTFSTAEFPHVIYATDLIRGYDFCYVCGRKL
jgi:hypothetical protein